MPCKCPDCGQEFPTFVMLDAHILSARHWEDNSHKKLFQRNSGDIPGWR